MKIGNFIQDMKPTSQSNLANRLELFNRWWNFGWPSRLRIFNFFWGGDGLKASSLSVCLGLAVKYIKEMSRVLMLFVQKIQIKWMVANCILWWRTKKSDSIGRIMWLTEFSLCDQNFFGFHHIMHFENIPAKWYCQLFYWSQSLKFYKQILSICYMKSGFFFACLAPQEIYDFDVFSWF